MTCLEYLCVSLEDNQLPNQSNNRRFFRDAELRYLWLVAAIAWLLVASLVILQMVLQQHIDKEIANRLISVTRYALVECGYWAVCTPFIVFFSRSVRWSEMTIARAVFTGVLGFVVLWTVHGIYRTALHGVVYIQIRPIGAPFRRGVGTYMLFNLTKDLWVYGSIIGFTQIREYYRRQRDSAEQLSQAELLLLKRQLQPHFLFNAFNSVSSLMHRDVNAADEMLSELGGLLRATLRDHSELKSRLGDEVALLKSYLDIEKFRFGSRLQYSIDVPAELEDTAVPSLILQPIVENAVLHGIAERRCPGFIEIHARRHVDRLVLAVSDNGVGLDPALFVERIGLGNTRARLLHLYGERHSFRIESLKPQGTLVTMSFPEEELRRNGGDHATQSAHHR